MNTSANLTEENIHTLYNNVPGGIFRCLYDEDLTLLETSDGFLDMLGISREELHTKYHNSLKLLICPEDLERTLYEVDRQLAKGNIKEIQYRLIHRDGHLITVLDKGTFIHADQGPSYFCCIALDITSEKEMEDELHLMLDRYRIIMEQTNDVIFEWDLHKDRFLVTDNWDEKFGPCTVTDKSGFYNLIRDPDACLFHPDDLPSLESCIRELLARQVYVHRKLRMMKRSGRYSWFHIRMTQQFDQNQKPYRIIGIIVDIDQEMNRSQLLKKRAEQDSMTGLYNKLTVQSLIRSYLQQEDARSTGALLIMDIDNFKGINDTRGHLYGDSVLNSIASNMRNSFRETDILGRIGGDEFIIFLKSVGSVENACQNAEKALRLFQNIDTVPDHAPQISGSIGIAMYPEDGLDYNTLFHKADTALYQAKQAGKNQYAFYNPKYRPAASRVKSLSLRPDPVSSPFRDVSSSGEVVEYAFHLLYTSPDFDGALTAVLDLIGRYYHLAHIYIYEHTKDRQFFEKTFDWYRVKNETGKAAVQRFSAANDLGAEYEANFDENSIFLCTDPSLLPERVQTLFAGRCPQGFLQYAIRENCVFRGLIGYETFYGDHFCAKARLDSLVLLSQLLSLFLLKNRSSANDRNDI